MGSIRRYIKGKYSERWKRGGVHSEENEENCDRCSSFLTVLSLTSVESLVVCQAQIYVLLSSPFP